MPDSLGQYQHIQYGVNISYVDYYIRQRMPKKNTTVNKKLQIAICNKLSNMGIDKDTVCDNELVYHRNYDIYMNLDLETITEDVDITCTRSAKPLAMYIRSVSYSVCALVNSMDAVPHVNFVSGVIGQSIQITLNDIVPYEVLEALRYSLNGDSNNILNMLSTSRTLHLNNTARDVLNEQIVALNNFNTTRLTDEPQPLVALKVNKVKALVKTNYWSKVSVYTAHNCRQYCAYAKVHNTLDSNAIQEARMHNSTYVLDMSCFFHMHNLTTNDNVHPLLDSLLPANTMHTTNTDAQYTVFNLVLLTSMPGLSALCVAISYAYKWYRNIVRTD